MDAKVHSELDKTLDDRRRSILVIDDEEAILESLEELFQEDFRVFKARTGEDGVELLRTHQVDLVILDLKLPGVDGLEILDYIRKLSKTLPVLVITGYSTIERAERCADLMSCGYLRKPIDSLALLARVKGILSRDQEIQNLRADQNGELDLDSMSSQIRESMEIIKQHYREFIHPKDIATQICLSREHLGKKFKKEVGFRIGEYINMLRIEDSRKLLTGQKDSKLSEISHKLGFKSESHFIRIFRKYAGMTPAGFRKSTGSARK